MTGSAVYHWVSYTFFPQAQRDTDTPDLGYHYNPLDYAVNIAVSNATVTVLPGTALAMYGQEYGVWLYALGAMNCTGTATSPNYIVRYNTVQEQSNTNWETTGWLSSVIAPQTPDTSTANFTFTDWSVLGSDYQVYTFLVGDPLVFQNCQFYGGEIYDVGPTFSSENSLFRRVEFYLRDTLGNTCFNTLYNNLFLRGAPDL